jgi:hypothetical protein
VSGLTVARHVFPRQNGTGSCLVSTPCDLADLGLAARSQLPVVFVGRRGQLSTTCLEKLLNSDRLNRWLTLGANVGVLVGIILLVIELDQNRDMMRAQTRNELARGLPDILGIPTSNNELTDSLIAANNGDSLPPAKSAQVAMMDEMIFRYWENVHYQYRQGLYDDSEFSRHKDTMKVVIARNSRLARFWCVDRQLYSEPFMRFMDDMLVNVSC